MVNHLTRLLWRIFPLEVISYRASPNKDSVEFHYPSPKKFRVHIGDVTHHKV